MIKVVWAILTALPELIKLAKLVQEMMKEREIQGKVKDGVKEIHEALKTGDNERLNRAFMVKPSELPYSTKIDVLPKLQD